MTVLNHSLTHSQVRFSNLHRRVEISCPSDTQANKGEILEAQVHARHVIHQGASVVELCASRGDEIFIRAHPDDVFAAAP